MLFYDSPNPAPNPRRVRIFAAEKGIHLSSKEVSIPKREQKAPDYVAKNPRGQTPILELDDGTVIAESVAIMRYLEAEHPDPPLFGTTAREIAEIEMWNRRVEMILMPAIAAVWVHTHPFTAALPGRNVEWGESNRPRVAEGMRFFDGSLEGREYLAWGGLFCRRHPLADDCRFRKIHRSRNAERMCKSSPVARTRFRPAKRFSLSSARRGKGLARHIVRSQDRLLNATFGRDA